jgi:hypothetical protein
LKCWLGSLERLVSSSGEGGKTSRPTEEGLRGVVAGVEPREAEPWRYGENSVVHVCAEIRGPEVSSTEPKLAELDADEIERGVSVCAR